MSYQEYTLVSVDTKDIGRLFHLLIINILDRWHTPSNQQLSKLAEYSNISCVYFPMSLNLVIVTELRRYEVCPGVVSVTDVYTDSKEVFILQQ